MPDNYIQVTIYKCQPSRIRPVVTENGIEYYPNYVDPITQEAGVGVFPDREFAQPGNVTYNAMLNYLIEYDIFFSYSFMRGEYERTDEGIIQEEWTFNFMQGIPQRLYHYKLGHAQNLDWEPPKAKGKSMPNLNEEDRMEHERIGFPTRYHQGGTQTGIPISMRWEGFPWYPDEAIEAEPTPTARVYHNVPSRFPEQPDPTTYDFEAKERGDKTIQVAGGWIFPNYEGDTSEFCSDREYNTLFKSVAWINPDEYEPALDKTTQKLEWGKPEPAEEVE